MFTWIFGSILVPTWLHFTLPNPPKSSKNPTPRAIKILIDFCFDFFSILAPFWGPSWSHVGHLFRAKTLSQSLCHHPSSRGRYKQKNGKTKRQLRRRQRGPLRLLTPNPPRRSGGGQPTLLRRIPTRRLQPQISRLPGPKSAARH